MAVTPRKLSPNQLGKRDHIVAAAKRVLLREGLAGCSSRAVARESGLTKGLIHYYFETVEEIVDTAMSDLFDAQVTSLRAAGEEHAEPADRFWAVIEAYLVIFEEPGLALLWFEYWLNAARRGRIEQIERVQDGLIGLITELLADAGVAEADSRARVLFSYVIGVFVRREVHAQTLDELRPEIATLSRLSTT